MIEKPNGHIIQYARLLSYGVTQFCGGNGPLVFSYVGFTGCNL